MPSYRKVLIPAFVGITMFWTSITQAAEQHGIAMHGTPKYEAGFTHLDYVNPDAPKGGTLKLSKTGSFDNLNNHVITGNNAEGLEYVNDRLLQRVWDEPFTMYGLVAQSVEMSDDRSQITFNLNPAARFHDGVPMTAEDVKYSYEVLRKHGHPVRRRVFGLVKNVEIINPHKIRFTFGEGYDRESPLILSIMPVLPKHYWEKHDISKTTLTPPLGSGPYKIVSVEPGRKVVYERVKDWWAKDLPVTRGQYNFDTITYTYFRDDDIALQSFKAGDYNLRREYDVTKWLDNYDFQNLAKGKVVKEEIAHGRPEWLKALIFNTRRPLFADRRVRQALGYMFNDEWINRNLYNGGYKRIYSAFANSELASKGKPEGAELELLEKYRKDLPPEVFGDAWQPPAGSMRDRQRHAIALLKEAGYSFNGQKLTDKQGNPVIFEILLGSRTEEKLPLEFARTLKRIGIEARVRTVDSAQFTGRLGDFDFDMVMFQWINSLSPGNEQVNYWGSQSGKTKDARNYAGIDNPAIDALADSIARAATREELVTRAHALDRALMQGYYMIPLFYLGRDLVAHETTIKRPEKAPVYGIVMETLWQEAGEDQPQ